MPLALDLTSTLTMGSILPVATTDLAKSPFSTLASLEGSILVPPCTAATKTRAPPTTRTAPPTTYQSLLLFFLPLPFATTTPSSRFQYRIRRQPEISSRKEFPDNREHWIRPDFRQKESISWKFRRPDRTIESCGIATI